MGKITGFREYKRQNFSLAPVEGGVRWEKLQDLESINVKISHWHQ